MKAVLRAFLLLLVVVAIAAGLAAYSIVRRGLSTREQPSGVETFIARTMRRLATPSAARSQANPVAVTPEVMDEALAHFADHCASCHANDGSGATEMGRSFYPPAPDMRAGGTKALTDGELFSIIEHGIRLTGMPAWGTGTPEGEQQSWALVHFIRRLPSLSAEDIARMEELNPRSPQQVREEDGDQAVPRRRRRHGGERSRPGSAQGAAPVEGRRQKAEGGRRKAEGGGRRKAEGRRQKAERRCRGRGDEFASGNAAEVRQGAGRRRCRGRTWPVGPPGVGAARAAGASDADGHGDRPHHRRNADEHHGRAAHRAHDQRHDARAHRPAPRRRHGHAASEEPAGGGRVHPLARRHPARQHGRRARAQLSRHPPGRDLRLSLHRQAERDLLVPQPLRLPGAARRLRAARHRAERARALPIRPRARRDAVGLDGREPGAAVQETEEAVGLLQHPPADRRAISSATYARTAGRPRSPNAARGARCG